MGLRGQAWPLKGRNNHQASASNFFWTLIFWWVPDQGQQATQGIMGNSAQDYTTHSTVSSEGMWVMRESPHSKIIHSELISTETTLPGPTAEEQDWNLNFACRRCSSSYKNTPFKLSLVNKYFERWNDYQKENEQAHSWPYTQFFPHSLIS